MSATTTILTAPRVVAACERAFGLPKESIASGTKDRRTAYARHAAAAIMHHRCEMPLVDIATACGATTSNPGKYGARNLRSTALGFVSRCQRNVDRDPEFRAAFARACQLLK